MNNDPLNNPASRYVRLRCVPATALQRGFEDRVLEVQNISSIERYPDLPSVAIVLTFQGIGFITAHNFDELTAAFNPITVKQGGDRLEEKLLAGEGARQAKLIEEAERKAAIERAANEEQLDADGGGEVISLDEARERAEARVELEASEARVELEASDADEVVDLVIDDLDDTVIVNGEIAPEFADGDVL